MRRIFFSLLIVLTAFRGMVGDAMAYGMTSGMTQQINALESIASIPYSMPAIGDFLTKKAASMPCHEAADDATTDSIAHSCNSCMVCHSPLIQHCAVEARLSQHVAAYAWLPERIWMSVDRSPLQKPPVF